jgi:hypothetical protein
LTRSGGIKDGELYRVNLVIDYSPAAFGADVEAAVDCVASVAEDGLDVEQAVAGAVVHVEEFIVVGIDGLENAQLILTPVLFVDV